VRLLSVGVSVLSLRMYPAGDGREEAPLVRIQ
jgi:hypothetical protein